jgi:hypothetical protein
LFLSKLPRLIYFSFILYAAKPQYLTVSLDGAGTVKNGSTIGPYKEGTEVTLVCESGGGKPIPKVTWFNGTTRIPGKVF